MSRHENNIEEADYYTVGLLRDLDDLNKLGPEDLALRESVVRSALAQIEALSHLGNSAFSADRLAALRQMLCSEVSYRRRGTTRSGWVGPLLFASPRSKRSLQVRCSR